MFTLVHGSSACLAINGFSQENEEERSEGRGAGGVLAADRRDAASQLNGTSVASSLEAAALPKVSSGL